MNNGVGSLRLSSGSGATPNCCNWSGGRSFAADAEGKAAAWDDNDEDARGCPADEDAADADADGCPADEDARGAADEDARGCPADEDTMGSSSPELLVAMGSSASGSRCEGALSSQPTTAARKILLATSSKPAGGFRYNALQFVQFL